MDKRTVDDILLDHGEINRLAGALRRESEGYVRLPGITPGERLMAAAVVEELLKRHALVNPAALAKVEEEAAQVPGLRAVIAKKDEVLNASLTHLGHALSLTPYSVKEAAEMMRVGRAVVEWLPGAENRYQDWLRNDVRELDDAGDLLRELRKIVDLPRLIAKARKGKHDA